jgi:hypothetical protein
MIKAKLLASSTIFLLTTTLVASGFVNSLKVQALNNQTVNKNDAVTKPLMIAADITVSSGGSYSAIRNSGTGGEVHHMPAFNSFNGEVALKHGQGPAIWMTVEDHRKTNSWGSSTAAKLYRADQKKLIQQGNFKQAMDKDIADVKGKFPGKYDAAITQAVTYYGTIQSLTVPKPTTPDTTTPDVDLPNG